VVIGCGAKESRTPEVSSKNKEKSGQTVEDELKAKISGCK
jgi:hypothetical protein